MRFKSGVKGIDAVIGDESEGGDCDEVICALRRMR